MRILSDEEFEAERQKHDQPVLPVEDIYQEGGGHDPDAVRCLGTEDAE